MPDTRTLQRRVLAATSISYIVVILDTSIVNVALGSIADALATNTAGLQWVVNAYTLTFASLLLTGGALGDRLGAKNVYFAGLAVFTLASALCGLAPNLAALTGARVLQGIGASMLVPCSLMLINRAYADPRRARPRDRPMGSVWRRGDGRRSIDWRHPDPCARLAQHLPRESANRIDRLVADIAGRKH